MSVDTAFIGYELEDYLYKLDDDGVVLNTEATPTEGFVDIERVVGLSSAPARDREREFYGADGGFVDAEFESVRPVVLIGTAYCNNYDLMEVFLDRLKANYAVSRNVRNLYIKIPGVGTRVVFCKSLGVEYDWERMRRTGQTPIQFILRAEDPALYGAELSDDTGLVSGTVSGRGYNKAFDYGYGAGTATSGVLQFVLGGNRPSYGKFLIHGPVENPTILNETTGQLMRFDIKLEPGDFLEIGLRYHTVRLNGATDRRNVLKGARIWFPFMPGNNTFRFGGTQYIAGPPDASLVALYRPAYR